MTDAQCRTAARQFAADWAGRGRGGRATAKPTDNRRTSADGFAVKMERT